jgi:hypothetical protein
LGIRVVKEWELSNFYMVNHTTNYNKIPASERKRMIFTSHSKIYDIEKFPLDNVVKVGISEEIGENVIRQPIDLERFIRRPINRKLTTILYLSHPAYGEGIEFMKKACAGYNLITVNRPTHNIEKLIYQADLVISVGRGALEALACGRNVILADHRKGQTKTVVGGGMLTEKNFKSFYSTNFTGRGQLVEFTEDTLRKEFQKYDPDRKIDVSEFDANRIVRQYEELLGGLEK